MQITTILAFITAMGGLEAVKWIVRYISCRKTDARKEEADVSSLEEENRRKKGGLVGRSPDTAGRENRRALYRASQGAGREDRLDT